MTMTTRIRLAELVAPPPDIELTDGTVLALKRLDGVAASLWYDWQQTPKEDRDPRVLWKIVERCLPKATTEQVLALAPEEAAAVIAIASGNVDRVMAELKNGLRPETQAAASGPETPLAPSSSPSPEAAPATPSPSP